MPTLDPRTGRIIPDERFPEIQFGRDEPLPKPDDEDDFFDLGIDFLQDVALAAPRAAEGLGRSLIDLGGAAVGQDLRLSEERSFLGRSETILGGFLEGAAQFALPFGGALKGLALARTATRGPAVLVRGLGLMTGGKGRFARNVAAGGVADFFAFGGHEQRLSNFVAKVPGLQQPVFEFLATKDEDGEIEGRIKAVLEGAGIGAAIDGVFAGIKAIKRGRDVRAGKEVAPQVKLKKILKEAEEEMLEAQKPLQEAQRQQAELELDAVPETLRAPEPEPAPVVVETPPPALGAEGEVLKRFASNTAAPIRSVIGGAFYRETDVVSLLQLLPEDGSSARIGELFVSNSPDLAIGQGTNTGVLIQFDAGKLKKFDFITAQEHKKPGTAIGTAKEFVVRGRDIEAIGQGIQAITIKAGTLKGASDKAFKVRFSRLAKNLVESGKWQKTELADGSVQYTRGKQAPAGQIKGGTKKVTQLSIEQMLEAKISVAARTVSDFGLDEADVAPFVQAFDEALEGGFADYLSIDAKDWPDDVKAFMGVGMAGGLDLSTLKTSKDVDLLIRQTFSFLEERLPGGLKKSKSDNITHARAAQDTADLLAKSPEEQSSWLASQVKQADDTEVLPLVLHSLLGGAFSRGGVASKLYLGKDVDPAILGRLGLENAESVEPAALLKQLHLELNRGAEIAGSFAKISGSSGRQFRNYQLEADDTASALTSLYPELVEGGLKSEELFDQIGEEAMKQRAEQYAKISELDNASKIAAALRLKKLTSGGKVLALGTEWMISNMLYSSKTWVTNFVFPTLTSVYVPIENMVGGVLTGNGGVINREWQTLNGMRLAIGDASRAGWATVKSGRPQLDPRATRAHELGLANSLFDSEVLQAAGVAGNWNPGSVMGHVVNALGKFSSVPMRIMQGSDEFVKTMVARGHGTALLTEQAVKLGKDPTAYVTENLPRMFDEGHLVVQDHLDRKVKAKLVEERLEGKLIDDDAIARRSEIEKEIREALSFDELNPITERLLARGREATATGPLDGDGTFDKVTREVQGFVSKFPIARLVLPFVTTPANIAKFGGQRVGAPLSAALSLPKTFYSLAKGKGIPKSIKESNNRFLRDFHSGDDNLRSEAIGRMALGTGIFGTMGVMATAGDITGAGPEDPEQRQLMVDAGWQPYSIRSGNKYISYQRADPFATILGMAADTVEVTKLAVAEEGEDQFLAISLGLITGITRNFTEKTFMTGFRQAVDAISDPTRHGGKLAGSFVGATLPRTFTQVSDLLQDPVLKDTHGLIAKLRARVPYFGNPPMRNMLGETVRKSLAAGAVEGSPASHWMDLFMPISYREVSDSKLNLELASLKHGFEPPPRQRLGIRPDGFVNGKGQDAYDRWSQLHGLVKVGGKTLRQTLNKLTKSRDYQRLEPLGNEFESSPRVRLINSVIQRFRRQSWQTLLEEYPDLATEWHLTQRQSRARRSGSSVTSFIQSADPFRL